ncbi:hypothetical protein, partial [Nocardia wallacei]|uniref:hypothetical protein n=1 Tax=Nocardia wallacei TaxID=480035 RepID=UPI0024578235
MTKSTGPDMPAPQHISRRDTAPKTPPGAPSRAEAAATCGCRPGIAGVVPRTGARAVHMPEPTAALPVSAPTAAGM